MACLTQPWVSRPSSIATRRSLPKAWSVTRPSIPFKWLARTSPCSLLTGSYRCHACQQAHISAVLGAFPVEAWQRNRPTVQVPSHGPSVAVCHSAAHCARDVFCVARAFVVQGTHLTRSPTAATRGALAFSIAQGRARKGITGIWLCTPAFAFSDCLPSWLPAGVVNTRLPRRSRFISAC